MKLYQVVIEIREAATGYKYPVISHAFTGKTKEEAWHYHASHLKSDSFLRDCEKKNKCGDVKCRTAVVCEGWISR